MTDPDRQPIAAADQDSDDDGDITNTRSGGGTFSPGMIIRMQYAGYLFMGFILCMMLKSSMGSVFSKLSVIRSSCEYLARQASTGEIITDVSALCSENTVVYRVSFALALFYLIHFASVSDLTCCIDGRTREQFQHRFFCVKSVVLVVFFWIAFWIPTPFFTSYAWLCMFVSAIFLVIQLIIIVDFSYQWNEDWGRRSESNSKWNCYLLAVAVLCYIGGAGILIYGFVKFVPHEDCNLSGFALILTLLAGIVYTLIAIWVPHGSIVPSGIVFLYTSMMCFSALYQTQDAHCNLLYSHGSQDWRMTILSGVFSALALAYSVVSSGGSRSSLSLADAETLETEDPDQSGHLSNYCFFYVIMICGSMYLAMVVTNWSVSGGSTSVATTSTVGVWVKLSSEFLTIAMYLWTLLAPYYCCADRDFGFETSGFA